MRRFFDLLIPLEVLSPQTLQTIRELNFSGVGASLGVRLLSTNLTGSLENLKKVKSVGEAEGLDVVSRITVDEVMSEGALKALLRKFRKRVEVFSVHALDRRLTALACRDSRVDVITLLPGSRLLKGDLVYISEYGKGVELLMAPVQVGSPQSRAKALAYYSRTVELLQRKGLAASLIFSSGAASSKTLRDPRSMASLLSLMGLTYDAALDAVSINVERLVAECRERLSGVVPVRGVRIVERDGEGGR
jgi:RNase P/RNase MRP subunit p30